jgi:glycosyltransferase involved in cell wall biosynthesis
VLQISYLNPIDKYGGVEGYILNLSRCLSIRHKVTVDILCAGKTPAISHSPFGNVITLRVPFIKKGFLFFISKYFYGKLVSDYLDLHSAEYDAIHFHGDNGLIEYGWSNKSILTLHGVSRDTSTLMKRIITFIPTSIEKNNAKKATIVFSVSTEAKEFFQQYNKEIHMIKQSIDPALFHVPSEIEKTNARGRLGIDNNALVGAIIGREPKRKGLHLAIEAINVVAEPRILLNAIGFPRETNVNNFVKFTGNVDEDTKLLYLSASDFFIFPSMKEGFPMSVLEAAACGLPLIVSKQSGVSELASLVPFYREISSNNPDDYADALKNLIGMLSKPDFYKVTHNVDKIEQYSTDSTTKIYIGAYEGLIQNRL